MKIKTIIVALIIGLAGFWGCDLSTPDAPEIYNPWDANNPNRPRPPEGLSAQAISETEIGLNWRDMSGNEDGFDIFEKTDGDSNFNLILSTESDVVYVDIQNRTPLTTYFYFVKAYLRRFLIRHHLYHQQSLLEFSWN